MSWSIGVHARKAPEIFRAIDAAEPTHELSDASTEQVRAAKAAAKALIEAQVVGGSDAAFGANLSGHATDGDKQSAGSTVSVNVFQAAEVAD
jgi:hypothetical protein